MGKADAPEKSLTSRAVGGAGWLVIQSVIAKALATVSQIVLAWYLLPQDYGVVSIALMIAGVISLIEDPGFKTILVRESESYRSLKRTIFFMALSTGSIASLLTLLAAPIASHLYDLPSLTTLIAVLALSPLIRSFAIIPLAKLEIGMRFREIAALNAATALIRSLLAIILVTTGLGPLSMILPIPIALAVQSVILNYLIKNRFLPVAMRRRHVSSIIRSCIPLFATAVITILIGYGDFFIVSLTCSTKELGLFFFAFSMSKQFLLILGAGLRTVLFSALASIKNDQGRQNAAFVRSVKLMADVASPLMLVQAAIAYPVFNLVFGSRWNEAIPIFQILCFGFVGQAICYPAGSLIRAQGRYVTYFRVQLAYGLCYVFSCGVGAVTGGVIGAAVGAAIVLIAFMPVFLCAGIGTGSGFKLVWSLLRGPLLLSVIAFAAALGLSRWMQGREIHLLYVAAGAGISFFAIYISGYAALDRQGCRQFIGFVRSLVLARFGK